MSVNQSNQQTVYATNTINLHTIILIVVVVLVSNFANYALTGKNTAGEFDFTDRGLPSGSLYMLDLAEPFVKDTYSFEKEVRAVARKLNIPPEWLMSVMYSESKFNASVSNHRGSGAVGLIQWMPQTAKDFGTTAEALKKMSHVEQLEYVYKYLNLVRNKYHEFNSLTDLYLAILYPRALEGDFCYTLYADPSESYRQNSGLDENDDGMVTVRDIDTRMKRIFPSAYLITKDGFRMKDADTNVAGL
ncbi:hypothetical protein C7N43_29165 [Sphingobacteriales bacterium UPWRP_1]|nr:hypothetical protein BVG80_18310 [Sphingobacteriales bacterium TSM_CSM]PSJ73426.1 hypothetical protein C7N43_29165 [Sphingobacteriales bacterium UPWRP_1]